MCQRLKDSMHPELRQQVKFHARPALIKTKSASRNAKVAQPSETSVAFQLTLTRVWPSESRVPTQGTIAMPTQSASTTMELRQGTLQMTSVKQRRQQQRVVLKLTTVRLRAMEQGLRRATARTRESGRRSAQRQMQSRVKCVQSGSTLPVRICKCLTITASNVLQGSTKAPREGCIVKMLLLEALHQSLEAPLLSDAQASMCNLYQVRQRAQLVPI